MHKLAEVVSPGGGRADQVVQDVVAPDVAIAQVFALFGLQEQHQVKGRQVDVVEALEMSTDVETSVLHGSEHHLRVELVGLLADAFVGRVQAGGDEQPERGAAQRLQLGQQFIPEVWVEQVQQHGGAGQVTLLEHGDGRQQRQVVTRFGQLLQPLRLAFGLSPCHRFQLRLQFAKLVKVWR